MITAEITEQDYKALAEWAKGCPAQLLGEDEWAARELLTNLVGVFHHGTICQDRMEWTGYNPERIVAKRFCEESQNLPYQDAFTRCDIVEWLVEFSLHPDHAEAVISKMVENGRLMLELGKIKLSDGPFPPTRLQMFAEVYRRQLQTFARSNAVPWYPADGTAHEQESAIDEVAGKFMAAISAGNFIQGPACKATCKYLGVKPTYAAIADYLKS